MTHETGEEGSQETNGRARAEGEGWGQEDHGGAMCLLQAHLIRHIFVLKTERSQKMQYHPKSQGAEL